MEADNSKRFSPSKLDVYKDCPRRYAYRYIDRIRREEQSVEAYLGSCVHKAFESLYEGVRHGKIAAEDEAVSVFGKEWEAGWSGNIVIRNKEYSRENWKQVGRDCVRSYYRGHYPFDEDKTVAIEKRVGFALSADGEPYRIEGFVDRLALGPDGVFEIHDYKTAKSLPTQQDADRDWQLGIYDIAVRENWPDAREVRLIWHYVRHGKSISSRRDPGQLQALKEEIVSVINAIKRDREFLPRPSALCDWCEYRDICPLWSHGEKVARLPPEQLRQDDGVRLVGELAALDAKKRECKEKLKELERDQKTIEAALLELADRLGLMAFCGEEAAVSITRKEEYKFPTKTHCPEAFEALEAELKESPLWKEVSHLDGHRLLEGYERKQWPQDWLRLAEEVIGRYAKKTQEKILRLRRRKDAED